MKSQDLEMAELKIVRKEDLGAQITKSFEKPES